MSSSDDVIRIYKEGYDCAQCILMAMKDRVDCDLDTAMKSISSMSMCIPGPGL